MISPCPCTLWEAADNGPLKSSQIQNHKTEALVVDAAIMDPAATQAGDPSPWPAHPLMTLSTARTLKPITASHPAGGERELMGPSLPRDSKIAAGLPPLRAMRGQSATAVTMARQKMGQFMQEGSIHFLRRDLPERRVEPDFPMRSDGHAGSGAHSGVPSDNEPFRKGRSPRQDHFPRTLFQIGIAVFEATAPCWNLYGEIPGSELSQAGEDPLHHAFDCLAITRARASIVESISCSVV